MQKDNEHRCSLHGHPGNRLFCGKIWFLYDADYPVLGRMWN